MCIFLAYQSTFSVFGKERAKCTVYGWHIDFFKIFKLWAGEVKQKSETYSPGSHVKAACHSSSPKLQSTVMAESLQGKSSNLRMSFNEGKGT